MPKMALLILLGSFLTVYLSAQESRKPRWPMPKPSRALDNSNGFRINEYRGYVKSLSSNERTEFAADAKISLGSLGVNPERVIVKFKDAETEQLVLQSLQFKTPLRDFKTVGAKVLQIPKGENQTELLAHLGALKELDGVDYVSPDYKIRIAAIPNDPDYPRLWQFHNIGTNAPPLLPLGLDDADIDAPEAWEVSTGSRSVIVGIIDTGIDYNHPDLVDNIWRNPGETGTDSAGNDKSSNGIDDDGNGFIDDFRGWDFVGNDNDPLDENGHGTHVAGTIGATGNDGRGVTGVNWRVSLVGLQIFDSSGSGEFSSAMAALDYATRMRFPITNNSYGGSEYVSAFEDLLKQNRDAGGLFIAAAGNSSANNDTASFYPANFQVENVISVAATNHKDELASFSNYGRTSVHLAAPGDPIYSTYSYGGYYYESGTSMAAPHVAGAAALIKSVWPNLSYSEVKNKILESVDVLYHPSVLGKLITDGRLNLARAVGGTPSPLPYRLRLQSSSPNVGSLSGGTRLNLRGVGFHPEIRVSVGMKPCHSIQVVSQLELNCTTSASAISGLHSVTATNPDGKRSTLTGAFRYQNPPTLNSLSASAGPLAGGNRITLQGNFFGTGTSVRLGESSCSQVQISSANQLSCVLPSSQEGTYRVVVVNRFGQESSEEVSYTYRPAPQVGSISPSRGLVTGGTILNVNGSGFVEGAIVRVGGQMCTNPQRISASQLTCTTPALSAGLHAVQVTNPEGQTGDYTLFETMAPRWVQTNGASCLSVCNGQGLISKASPEGAFCTSGEVVSQSARGVIRFTYGCKPNRNCVAQGPVNGANHQARFCYGPGQRRNNERTDITVGCFCSL